VQRTASDHRVKGDHQTRCRCAPDICLKPRQAITRRERDRKTVERVAMALAG